MKIPTKLNLAGITYRVEWQKGLTLDGIPCYGHCSPDEHVIRLETGMREPRRTQIFLHELTHAVLWTIGHELYNDEQFVNSFANLLHQALEVKG